MASAQAEEYRVLHEGSDAGREPHGAEELPRRGRRRVRVPPEQPQWPRGDRRRRLDHRRRLLGDGLPTDDMTVEYWYRNTNINADYQTLHSYSAYNVRGYLGAEVNRTKVGVRERP